MRLPIRTLTTCAAFGIFVPGGHIAAPAALFFLRFLNNDYKPELLDWVVLGLSAFGLTLMVVSWRARSALAFVGAVVVLGAAMLLAFVDWADPFDGFMLLTGIPFLGLAVLGFFKVKRERAPHD